MPRTTKHLFRLLFVMVVGFVSTIVTMPAAHATATANVIIECTSANGGAVYSITVNGDIDGHSTALIYDNGYTQWAAPDEGQLFWEYGTDPNTDSAGSARVNVGDGFSGSTIADVHFDRSQCGVPDNRPPVADPLTGSVDQNTAGTFTLPGHDPDGDVLTYSLVTLPTYGTASVSGDQLTYTPDGIFTGTESFTYQVDDGHGGSAQGSVTIQVDDVDDVTPVPPTFQQVDMLTRKASITIPDSSSVQYHVYRTMQDGVTTWDEGIRTGFYEFQAGETIRVVAENITERSSLAGTTEWVYRTYIPLEVRGAASGFENSFQVTNPNRVPVKLSWSGTSLWLAARTTRVVNTTAFTISWTAVTADDEYVAHGSTVLRQVRPVGAIRFDCRGRREVTKLVMDNRASNVPVIFWAEIGNPDNPAWTGSKKVGAGARVTYIHRGHLKPGRRVYLYAGTSGGNNDRLLARVRVPRGC